MLSAPLSPVTCYSQGRHQLLRQLLISRVYSITSPEKQRKTSHVKNKKCWITKEARSTELVTIILYPASPSRIIVSLKSPGSTTMLILFRSKTVLLAIFSQSCKSVFSCFIADAFLDYIRQSRYMN